VFLLFFVVFFGLDRLLTILTGRMTCGEPHTLTAWSVPSLTPLDLPIRPHIATDPHPTDAICYIRCVVAS